LTELDTKTFNGQSLDLNNIGKKIEIKVNERFDRIALINIVRGDNLAPSFIRRLINKLKSILQ
ncbi:MAG: hypothetical protein K2Q22_16120, partial [Cytophagales bacterium]|nr:hypothetical protein [Cytophagales bacterium]